jgi:phosphatidylserine/phosphatidylglycerophosphate/cardiolipin synthase-like enzyme
MVLEELFTATSFELGHSMNFSAHPFIIPFRPDGGQARRPGPGLLCAILLALTPALALPKTAGARPVHHRFRDSRGSYGSSCPAPASLPYPAAFPGEHYSPEENLEAIDVALIDHAKKTIDIAMYAFTDRPIADALLRAARRGVKIRIYRDRIQIHDRGDKTRRLLASRAGQDKITVRVKHNSPRNIMHLKAYVVDRSWLRTGSANWSPPGEGAWCRRGDRSRWNQQDNNLFLTRNPREIRHFEKTFERIFDRGGGRHGNRDWSPSMESRHRRRD